VSISAVDPANTPDNEPVIEESDLDWTPDDEQAAADEDDQDPDSEGESEDS
jgi:hypothetical protein